MRYPTLSEMVTTRDMLDVFGGYNHNLRIGEGEFYSMKTRYYRHDPSEERTKLRAIQEGLYPKISCVMWMAARSTLAIQRLRTLP